MNPGVFVTNTANTKNDIIYTVIVTAYTTTNLFFLLIRPMLLYLLPYIPDRLEKMSSRDEERKRVINNVRNYDCTCAVTLDIMNE